MRHQAKNGFRSSFLGIPQHQEGYLVYLPSTRKIISSYYFFLYEIFSSALAYTPQPYSEAMAVRPYETYTPCATSSREQTGDIITLEQFEQENLLSETNKDTEIGDESDDDSMMPPLLSKEDMDAMNSGNDSDHDPISTELLEDIRERSQSHLNVNRR